MVLKEFLNKFAESILTDFPNFTVILRRVIELVGIDLPLIADVEWKPENKAISEQINLHNDLFCDG